MPAEHALAPTIAEFPQYNRPLALASQALAECRRNNAPLAIIDIGANIGDTIALIEQRCPGISHYLCIEADPEIAEICRLNHIKNRHVSVERCFIGEDEGTAVWLQDDGHANASTKIADTNGSLASTCDHLVRLDTIASSFAEAHDGVSLIKVDTEGYDFSVLRSARQLLQQYQPALYFEWYPKLLTGLDEDIWNGFKYLSSLGYHYYIFFTNQGDYYCSLIDPEQLLVQSLAALTTNRNSPVYFDVFTCSDRSVFERLIELSALLADQRDQLNSHEPGRLE
jgi:FkbM family methyltransferase